MLLYMRRYRKKHKKALAAYMRKYRKKHPRRKRTAEENALRREVRVQNSTAASRKKDAAWAREWRRKNRKRSRELFTAAKHKRRAAIKRSGSFTASEWSALKEKHGNCCLCCRKKKRLEPDHVRPLSKGGSGKIGNIQPLCGTCNRRKGTKTTDYRRRNGS